jgi:glutathionylspermidine synthase
MPGGRGICQKQLTQAIHASVMAGIRWLEPSPRGSASIVFSSFADHREERGTTEFYLGLLGSQMNGDLPYRISYHGLDDLRVTRDCLLTAHGERVDVLYKLYPTADLVKDRAPDGTLVGLALLELVRKRRLAVINPPISFLLSNKALMVVLWAMHLVRNKLFTPEEHMWMERYLLPTYLDASDAQGKPLFPGRYVVKPVYGAEGISVTIRDKYEVIEQNMQHFYDHQRMIYQQYTALPTTTIQMQEGPAAVNLVYNCFMAGNIPSAIGVRASQKLIIAEDAFFLPVCHPRA